MNSESTLSDALSEVDTALAASDNERAAGMASELLLAYPNAVAVLRQRARALAASGRSLQAAEVHRRVLEILPADGDAMAGLARTLHSAGQTTEARDAAQQALDYLPTDETLKRIAAGEGQSFQPNETSMRLRKALAQTQVGLHDQGIASLRNIVSKSPDRIDAKVALMQALWRNGARINAAEQAQAVLDDYPNCLNAHLLMLQMWHIAGASEMERVHQQAIEQVDPDHRMTRALLGADSPLQVKEVPARPAPADEPLPIDEDPLAREDWVQNLVAASSALPKPLEQLREQDTTPAIDETSDEAGRDEAGEAMEAGTDEVDFLSSFSPLEWSTASDLSEEAPAQDDFTVPWLDGNAKDEFAPSRPRAAVPDPRDGVPAELDPLEWEAGADESATTQKDFSTAVDGGTTKHAATPANVEDEGRASDDKSLKPLAAAGALAAATSKARERDDAADEAGEAIQATASAGTQADHPAAQPESTPQQTREVSKAAQAMNAEMESASMKPMPIDAVEFVDEDTDRWDDDAIDAIEYAGGNAAPFDDEADEEEAQPASSDKPLRPVAAATVAKAIVSPQEEQPAQSDALNVVNAAPAEHVAESSPASALPASPQAAAKSDGDQVEAPPAVSQAPSAEETGNDKNNAVMKAVAVATAASAAIKKHKKKSAEKTKTVGEPVEEKAVEKITPANEAAPVAATAIAATPAASLEETAADESGAIAPSATGKPAKAGKSAKPAKKPAAKPTAREAQTEKVRKTYERAIATAKREDMPKLIGELKQAADVDPDNKIIFELLGQAYNRSGDIPAAINAYRKALELAGQA